MICRRPQHLPKTMVASPESVRNSQVPAQQFELGGRIIFKGVNQRRGTVQSCMPEAWDMGIQNRSVGVHRPMAFSSPAIF